VKRARIGHLARGAALARKRERHGRLPPRVRILALAEEAGEEDACAQVVRVPHDGAPQESLGLGEIAAENGGELV
jgi:hypothetical protein